MSDREKELQRLYDVVWNVGLTLEQILEQKKSPDILVDAVLHGLERTPDNVSMIYRFIASATNLSASTRQELCWGVLLPYLEKAWSKDEAKAFKEKHPLKDGHDPKFINIREVEARVAKCSLVNKGQGPYLWADGFSWGFPFAQDVLQIALGDIPLTDENVQQLHLSLCRFWADELDGLETNLGDDNRLSVALRLLRICAIKYSNIKQLVGGLAYPADFGITHRLLF